MPDKNFNIGINFESHGGADAEAELAKLRAQIKSAKDDTAAYNARLREMAGDSAESVESTEKLTEATSEAEKGIKGFNTHGKDMHKLIHTISEISPLAGFALKAAFNPGTIGIAGIVFALSQLVHLLEEEKKKTEELITKQAELKTAEWEFQRDAIREARDAANEYSDALQKIYKQKDSLKTLDAEEKARLETQIAGVRALAAAQEELEIAKAGGDKVKEEEIRARYSRNRTSNDLNAEQQRIDQMEKAKQRSDEAFLAAKGESDAANERKAAGDPNALTAVLAKTWLEQHAGEVAKAQSRVDELQETIKNPGWGGNSRAASARSDLPEATANLDKLRKETEAAEAAVHSHEQTLKKLEDEASATKSALEQQRASSEQLDQAIKIAKSVLEENKKAAADRAPIELQTRIAKTGIGNLDFEFSLVDKYKKDKNSLSADEKQHLISEYSMFAGPGAPRNLEAAISAFATAQKNPAIAYRITEKILSLMEKMGADGVKLAQSYQDQERRLSNIESQLKTTYRQR